MHLLPGVPSCVSSVSPLRGLAWRPQGQLCGVVWASFLTAQSKPILSSLLLS